MHNLHITGLYAGILGLMMLVLSMRVSGLRFKLRASIGTEASPKLLEEVRRHGNFIEWVPMALILMGIAEINGVSPFQLHLLGGLLVFGRVLHPLGLFHNIAPHPLRALGATLTFLIVLYWCGVVIWQFMIK